MAGFVYKWTNNINNKWYIGSHKGTADDGYRHSSPVMAAAEEKYGIKNFSREILFEGDYEKDKIRSVIETRFLRAEDAANNPMSYNRSNISGANCLSYEARQKISKTRKSLPGPNLGRTFSKKHRENISKSKIGNSYIKGIPKTIEHKKALSLAKQGKNNPMYGKHHTEEVKEKLRKPKGPQPIIVCPYCRVSGGQSLMKRWHFDNCKEVI